MASRTFTSAEIAVLAMRKAQVIGAYDTSATAQQTAVALEFLDLLISEFVSTEELQKFTVVGQTFPLATDTGTYTVAFDDELDYVHSVKLRTTAGVETSLRMINREEYEEVEDKTKGGLPDRVYIPNDGTRRYIMYPVPTSTNAGRTVVVDGQKFATNQTKLGAAHGLPAAFQRYLVNQLACDIGSGPLIQAPEVNWRRWDRVANRARDAILGRANRANTSRPRFTETYMP